MVIRVTSTHHQAKREEFLIVIINFVVLVCFVVILDADNLIDAHECLGSVIYLKAILLKLELLSCDKIIPLIDVKLLSVLVHLKNIGVYISIQRVCVLIILEHSWEGFDLVWQPDVHLLLSISRELLNELLKLFIRLVLHASRYSDEDPLEFNLVDDLGVVVNRVGSDPLDGREVWARLEDPWEQLREEGVLAHILIVVSQLDCDKVARKAIEGFEMTDEW